MIRHRLVTAELFRTYRPILLFVLTTMVLIVAAGMTAIDLFGEVRFSLWLTIAGSVSKFWPGVIGLLVTVVHLRPFLAAGLTRRDIMAGTAGFGLIVALVFAVLVPLGHGVEHLLLGLGDPVPGAYPAFSAATAVREFGYVLPGSLGFLVSGVAVGAAFYRFGAWTGLALLIPAAAPAVAAEVFFGLDGDGGLGARLLPYLPALLIVLVLTVLGALLGRWLLREVAVRRAAV